MNILYKYFFCIVMSIIGNSFVTMHGFAQWEKTTYPGVLTANDTRFCITDNYFFVSPDPGTLYRSSDHGQSWEDVSASMPHQDLGAYRKTIRSIVYGNSHLIASFGTMYPEADSLDGIYISADNGDSWNEVLRADSGGMFDRLYNIDSHIYGYSPAPLRSDDDGATWNMINIPKFTSIGMAGNAHSIYIAAILDNGVYRSSDLGASWISLPNSSQNDILSCISVTEDDIYLAGSYIYRSSDSGVHWTILKNGSVINGATFIIPWNNVLFAGGGNDISDAVFISFDSGYTWSDISANLPQYSTNILCVDSEYVYAGSDGIYRRPLADFKQNYIHSTVTTLYLHISPNPAKEWLDLSFGAFTSQTLLVVFDALGRHVLSRAVPSGVTSYRLNVGSLPGGVYAVRIGDRVSRFVKE